ncbi:MAG: DNA-processing protein DprA, partial [Selenomonadales bacterium]|nr:DNA-processing protein DprA [Selenomonadales bacterium]
MVMRYFGSAKEAWQASIDDWYDCGVKKNVCSEFVGLRDRLDIERMITDWEANGIRLCMRGDAEYPSLLKEIFDPPSLLYYRGTIPKSELTVGIVGARRSTTYGRQAARKIASELAASGVVVVSGAARGIDTSSHLGALENGKTIAVLGCGVDVAYPPENAKLLADIEQNGAVISEYPPGTQPRQGFFPARNRIISGISAGLLVVEAAEKSGALITATCAMEEGRDVFAVPGSIFSDVSVGTNRLIQDGVKPITCGQDILDEYQMSIPKQEVKKISLTKEEHMVHTA